MGLSIGSLYSDWNSGFSEVFQNPICQWFQKPICQWKQWNNSKFARNRTFKQTSEISQTGRFTICKLKLNNHTIELKIISITATYIISFDNNLEVFPFHKYNILHKCLSISCKTLKPELSRTTILSSRYAKMLPTSPRYVAKTQHQWRSTRLNTTAVAMRAKIK